MYKREHQQVQIVISQRMLNRDAFSLTLSFGTTIFCHFGLGTPPPPTHNVASASGTVSIGRTGFYCLLNQSEKGGRWPSTESMECIAELSLLDQSGFQFDSRRNLSSMVSVTSQEAKERICFLCFHPSDFVIRIQYFVQN